VDAFCDNYIGWRDAAGKLAGYVRAAPAEDDPKTLICLEAAGSSLRALAVLADLYQRGAYEKLACFTLPYLHPLLQHLRRGAVIVEDRYFDISGWRVRIINLKSALQKMIPLLEARLSDSRFADWTGDLLLDAGEQKATLHITAGRVIVTDAAAPHLLRGGSAIARFLLGSDDADEIIRQAGMECRGLAQPLARALFPNLHPMLSHWDEY
jgi:hypothetical protein